MWNMIQPNTDEDIADEKFKWIQKHFIDNYDDFTVKIIAYYMTNPYYWKCYR